MIYPPARGGTTATVTPNLPPYSQRHTTPRENHMNPTLRTYSRPMPPKQPKPYNIALAINELIVHLERYNCDKTDGHANGFHFRYTVHAAIHALRAVKAFF